MEPDAQYKYWVFISYSHQDNLKTRKSQQHSVPWADWLHDSLETWVIPKTYSHRLTPLGEPMPERLFPSFRDEAELPSSPDLESQIRDALKKSRFLVVIASPRSASSRYVNEEVRYFRELGRGDRILTLIVDGEPNVSKVAKLGWDKASECFCPALIHPIRSDGSVDLSQTLSEEPIGADARHKADGPPRELRFKELRTAEGKSTLEFAKLKLIAGILGISFDDIVRRDLVRKRKKAIRTLILATVLFSAICLALVGGLSAYSEAGQKKAARREAARNDIDTSMERQAQGHFAQAIAYLARASSSDSENTASAEAFATLLLSSSEQRPSEVLRAHESPVLNADFSPDSTQLLTYSGEGLAVLWNTSNWQILHKLNHPGKVLKATFSPKGDLILAFAEDDFGSGAYIWEVSSGKLLMSFPSSPDHKSNCGEFSKDGRLLLLVGSNVTLYSTQNWTPLKTFQGLNRYANACTIDSDGTFVAASNSERTLVWDAQSGAIARAIPDTWDLGTQIFFTYKAKGLVVWAATGTKLWDLADGSYKTLSASGKFVPMGQSGLEYTRHGVNLRVGRRSLNLPPPDRSEVVSAEFNPDGTQAAVVFSNGLSEVWSTLTYRKIASLNTHVDLNQVIQDGGLADVDCVDFSPNGKWVATTNGGDRVFIWSTSYFHPLLNLYGHEDAIRSIRISNDDTKVATASFDTTARMWDVSTGAPLWTEGSQGWLEAISFGNHGSQIVHAGKDLPVSLRDARTGKLQSELNVTAESPKSLFFSDAGESLVMDDDNSKLLLWRKGYSQWTHLNGLTLASARPTANRSGKLVPGLNRDGGLELLDIVSGERRLAYHSDKYVITSTSFSPDGENLVGVAIPRKDSSGLPQSFSLGIASGSTFKHADLIGMPRELPRLPAYDSGARVMAMRKDGTIAFFSLAQSRAIGLLGTEVTQETQHKAIVELDLASSGRAVAFARYDRTACVGPLFPPGASSVPHWWSDLLTWWARMRLDERGHHVMLTDAELEERHNRLTAIRSKATSQHLDPSIAPYYQWLDWLMQFPTERATSPYSSIKRRDAADKLIEASSPDPGNILLSLELDPANSFALLLLTTVVEDEYHAKLIRGVTAERLATTPRQTLRRAATIFRSLGDTENAEKMERLSEASR